MNHIQEINGQPLAHALDEAIAAGSIAGVSWRSKTGWVAGKGRFVPSLHRHEDSLTISLQPGKESVDQPQSGQTVGVSFRRGHRKWMFETKVVEQRHATPASGGNATLVICVPDAAQAVQRRMYERATPAPGKEIPVTLSSGPGDSVAEIAGRLRDLSAGGISVDVDSCPPWPTGQTIHCAIDTPNNHGIVKLEAVIRHCDSLGAGGSILGMQFVGFEASCAGRRSLDAVVRLVLFLQRGVQAPAHSFSSV